MMSCCVDLAAVNHLLRRNPGRRCRRKGNLNLPHLKKRKLQDAKFCAGVNARLLARYHQGRELLNAESPKDQTDDPEFWWARAIFYKAQYEQFYKDEYTRSSRSVTPAYIDPLFSSDAQYDPTIGEAGNVALDTTPGHKGQREDEHCETQSQETRRPTTYHERFSLQAAKDAADRYSRDLKSFPSGRALLDSENHSDKEENLDYWKSRAVLYSAKYQKLEQLFWERWRASILGGGGPPPDYWGTTCKGLDTYQATDLTTTRSQTAGKATLRAHPERGYPISAEDGKLADEVRFRQRRIKTAGQPLTEGQHDLRTQAYSVGRSSKKMAFGAVSTRATQPNGPISSRLRRRHQRIGKGNI
ncbi:MAG: hypothetical protein Q9217_003674 [Psora testacea]